jgi:hypothetical protein
MDRASERLEPGGNTGGNYDAGFSLTGVLSAVKMKEFAEEYVFPPGRVGLVSDS